MARFVLVVLLLQAFGLGRLAYSNFLAATVSVPGHEMMTEFQIPAGAHGLLVVKHIRRSSSTVAECSALARACALLHVMKLASPRGGVMQKLMEHVLGPRRRKTTPAISRG